MAQAAKAPRQNRTITVDFHDEVTYSQLFGDTKAFVEFVLALFSPSASNSNTNRPVTATAL